MFLNRNSNIAKKSSGCSSWGYFLFITCILVILALGAKDKIRESLQGFLMMPKKTSSISTKEDVEAIINEFIKNNPQVIISSLQEMQKREYEESLKQAQMTIRSKKSDLEGLGNEIAPYAGNKNGDVTVVTFLDYRCGYCKKANEDLKELIKKDSKVKVVYKEFPVLGELSRKLARTALAVYLVDSSKYIEFHNLLMAAREANEQFIQDTLVKIGVDAAKVKELTSDKRVDDALSSTFNLAKEIGVRGTPAFVIGDNLIPGAIDLNSMMEMVKSVREKNK